MKAKKDKFICQACGRELYTLMVLEHLSFDKKYFQTAVVYKDFANLYDDPRPYVLVDCYCRNPQLSKKDEKLIAEYYEISVQNHII